MIYNKNGTAGIVSNVFCPKVFKWFASADNVRQLALSHDLSKGIFDSPAVQLLVNTTDHDAVHSFLDVCRHSSDKEALRNDLLSAGYDPDECSLELMRFMSSGLWKGCVICVFRTTDGKSFARLHFRNASAVGTRRFILREFPRLLK